MKLLGEQTQNYTRASDVNVTETLITVKNVVKQLLQTEFADKAWKSKSHFKLRIGLLLFWALPWVMYCTQTEYFGAGIQSSKIHSSEVISKDKQHFNLAFYSLPSMWRWEKEPWIRHAAIFLLLVGPFTLAAGECTTPSKHMHHYPHDHLPSSEAAQINYNQFQVGTWQDDTRVNQFWQTTEVSTQKRQRAQHVVITRIVSGSLSSLLAMCFYKCIQ